MFFGCVGCSQKGLPYEEAVRVPLLIRNGGVAPRSDERLVAVNVDLAATVLDTFGLADRGEGQSLLAALRDPGLATRDHVFLENYTEGTPPGRGVVTGKHKYVEYSTGEIEIYDLDGDPYELESQHAAPGTDTNLPAWSAWIEATRALVVIENTLVAAEVGVPYLTQFEASGGTEPIVFSAEGNLPPGFTFGSGGLLEGTPTTAGIWTFGVWAHDASRSPFDRLPQSFSRVSTLTVGEPVAAAALARLSDTSVRLSLHTRPGVRVQVRATTQAAGDGVRVDSAVVIADARGIAIVPLNGLRPDRAWHWVA